MKKVFSKKLTELKIFLGLKKDGNLDTVRFLYVLSGVLGTLTILLIVWFSVLRFSSSPRFVEVIGESTPPEQKTECDYERTLDGICVSNSDEVSPRIVGIMVENALDAQPLAGVAQASVVYEATAEGNIPRFLALYPEESEVEKVGPVRSARPYYLDWISEYPGAMYMHVGGSPEAISQIHNSDLFDLDEFFRGWYYWRSENRFAPHNVYTSSNLWQKAMAEYGSETPSSTFSGWLFAPQDECQEECVPQVSLQFSEGAYEVEWRYSASTTQYEHFERGVPDRDEDGTLLVADTVIVQKVQAAVIDAIGRQRINTVGEGEVMIFRNGHIILGKWKKDSRTSRTEWFDELGNPIALKSGKIWIEVVSQFGEVSWEKNQREVSN